MDFLKHLISSSTLILIIGSIITVISGYYAVISQKKTTQRYIATCAAIGGFLIVVSSVISSFETSQDINLIKSQSMQIIEMAKENRELNQKIFQLDSTNISQSKEIVNLSKQNSKLSFFVANDITGGNSFCYFEILFPMENENTIWRKLKHVGDFPLHNLNIRIADSYRDGLFLKKYNSTIPIEEIEKMDERIYKETFFKVGQGNVADDMKIIKIPLDLNKYKFSIFFTARNGEWHQDIVLNKVKGQWQIAIRVTKYDTNQKLITLHEKISKDFPKNDKGDIDW